MNDETLIAGTPGEVEEEVKAAIRDAARGGGFVLTSGNTLQPGTDYDNYLAMRAAAVRYGTYPIHLGQTDRSTRVRVATPASGSPG